MSTNTVSQTLPLVNENSAIHIDFLNENTPIVSSLDVAKHFQKKHQHVLRDIEKLCSICPKSFCESNFGRTSVAVQQPNGGTRPSIAYTLTRDAFSLLVMGFTGTAAIRWKLKYIEAFNALEHEVRNNIMELAREAGYTQGMDDGQALMLPVLQAIEVESFEKGFKEGKSKKYDRLVKVRKALDYMQSKGLKLGEAATLVGMSRQSLAEQLRAFGIHTKRGVIA